MMNQIISTLYYPHHGHLRSR